MKNRNFKRFVAIIMSACVFGSLVSGALAASFSDVTDSHWANRYVERAKENSLVEGYGDGLYGVEDNVKSTEWCKMLVQLLFAEDFQNAIDSGMDSTPWWNPYVQISSMKSLLDNTAAYDSYVEGGSTGWVEEMVSEPISRYNMAQTIYNSSVRLEWESGDTSDITSSIADCADVPERYQTAVKYCYTSGLILGIDSVGTFAGNSGMTRGQAATVLCRLLDVVEGTHDFGNNNSDENPPVSGVASRLTIETATSWYTTGYKFEVTVAGDAIPGKLADDSEISDENILAILSELEIIIPEGTSWGDGSNGDKYYYGSDSPAADGGGCNAFAGMVCDLLYGHGAESTSQNDLSKVKCGDIVYLYNSPTDKGHWIVVTGVGVDPITNAMTFTSCEGNADGQVKWDALRYVAGTEYLYSDITIYSFY